MDSIIRKIEDVYESLTIFRAFVICENDVTAKRLASQLDERNHSVVFIDENDILDERPLYATKINLFQDASRMLIMSYATWHTLKDIVETRVLPEQNMIILVNLEDGVVSYISRYLHDASVRGFVLDAHSHFVVIQDEEIICE